MEPTIGVPVTFTVFQELCKFLDGSTVLASMPRESACLDHAKRLETCMGFISRGSKMAARAVIARVAVAAVRPSVLGT